MGGMTTAGLLTQHPEITAAACIMGSPAMIRYRERILYHAGAAGFFLPNDYEKLLGWIDAYDLDSQIDTLAERPFLIWHGTEDEKIPYEHIKDFIEKHPKDNIEFISEDERHLVRGATMDLVTEFFTNNLSRSTDI